WTRIGVERGHVPVLLRLDTAIGDAQPMPGQQLEHLPKRRRRSEKIPQRQIPFERREIDLAFPERALRERRQLAGEMKDPVEHGVEERFLAEAIACREQLLPASVVNGERKHPFEMLETGRSKFFVRVQDRFRIGDGPESMTFGFEEGPD